MSGFVSHLRFALIYFIAWIGVDIVAIREYVQGRLMPGPQGIADGVIYPLFLLGASIIFLALFIRSLMLYFQGVKLLK